MSHLFFAQIHANTLQTNTFTLSSKVYSGKNSSAHIRNVHEEHFPFKYRKYWEIILVLHEYLNLNPTHLCHHAVKHIRCYLRIYDAGAINRLGLKSVLFMLWWQIFWFQWWNMSHHAYTRIISWSQWIQRMNCLLQPSGSLSELSVTSISSSVDYIDFRRKNFFYSSVLLP